ncbi:hypothetical protein ANCDUO_01682 [Ancylostoma duodenale]|uniref:Carboxylesterase type B domain-containing protein n=1 Tax=Ancylostoma duodenale TaxID=51022 RepID=A0A0C2H8M7_9BILA|nr:hypothetical protein ANCDUO_01682 [Ancylostoma duodenale]
MVNWDFLREDVIMQDGHSRSPLPVHIRTARFVPCDTARLEKTLASWSDAAIMLTDHSMSSPRPSTGYEVRSVNTAWGVVKGELVNPDGGDLAPVTQFLGVPYGVAPSGQFRFNMAISAAKWTHLPKEARKLSPACIQTQLPELSETRIYAAAVLSDTRLLSHIGIAGNHCGNINTYKNLDALPFQWSSSEIHHCSNC